MRKLILIYFITAFNIVAYAQGYTITAHLTGFKNGAKFYLQDLDVDANIDSAILKDGQFIMHGKLAETPQVLWLCSTFENEFYYTTLFIGNEKITVKGDKSNFPFDLSITGSKTQDDENLIKQLTGKDQKRRNKLLEEYLSLKGDSTKSRQKALGKQINMIDSTNEAVRKDFISKHLNSYEALNELFYLKNTYSKPALQNMYNQLQPLYKQSRYGQRISNYLKVGEALKKGDIATDFTAMDKQGKTHHLSEIKGKYILLDFSATYCGPCMESVEDLKIISKKYADKLDIITFSEDGSKANWLTGINRDKPDWLSLWDGKGAYGETILKYGVSGIPTFFLIDQSGKIVSTWTGYGKLDNGKGSLESKVDKLMAAKK